MQVKKIWLIKSGSKFIASDESSGGYPYETDFWRAERFDSLKEALSYACIGTPDKSWEIYECDEVGASFVQKVRGADDMYEIELEELKRKYNKTA